MKVEFPPPYARGFWYFFYRVRGRTRNFKANHYVSWIGNSITTTVLPDVTSQLLPLQAVCLYILQRPSTSRWYISCACQLKHINDDTSLWGGLSLCSAEPVKLDAPKLTISDVFYGSGCRPRAEPPRVTLDSRSESRLIGDAPLSVAGVSFWAAPPWVIDVLYSFSTRSPEDLDTFALLIVLLLKLAVSERLSCRAAEPPAPPVLRPLIVDRRLFP